LLIRGPVGREIVVGLKKALNGKLEVPGFCASDDRANLFQSAFPQLFKATVLCCDVAQKFWGMVFVTKPILHLLKGRQHLFGSHREFKMAVTLLM
jgi:hypothetical protein